jgi:hypothetical protein
MSLKEFDAKQFLLEKGERVGLGIALTLMVLILIFSLFMPSKGFFSGSPAAKAKVLAEGTTKLDNALKSPTNVPKGDDLPQDTKDRLIKLDTTPLGPGNYATLGFFEPAKQESPARRPPKIYNMVEDAVAVKSVLIDTYLFNSDFSTVVVLRESGNNAAASAGGNNPFQKMYGNKGKGNTPPGASPQGMSKEMQRTQNRIFNPNGSNNLQGLGGGETEYTPKPLPVSKWNPQELTARQPRPLRVAVIGGSFPYKAQLEEFKQKLRLSDINAVLNEPLSEKDKESKAFEFLGVEVQRREIDAAGNKGEWQDLQLAQAYQLWLKHTFWPLQPEDPKINLVKFDGLVAPLLRVFHPDKKVDPTMRTPGMMRVPGMPQPAGARGAEAEGPDVSKDYPDIVAKLPLIQDTLDKLSDVQVSRIAAPKSKTDFSEFNPFKPYEPPADDAATRNGNQSTTPSTDQDLTIPEYALVRLVDVDLAPGKNYQYRVRIRMVNPNYQHEDVASPEYKKAKDLTSKDWYEIKQIARVPPELMYYVVDEKQIASQQEQKEITKKGNPSAQSRLWSANKPSGSDPIVFQFHRWVESTPLNKDKDIVPVGDWAIADRVFVSRGEYVGRKVRVDLPIWKYSQNAYVLPIEEQKKRNAYDRRTFTGLDVDFGFDNSPTEDTILVDFEGGRVFSQSPKMDDTCRTEVLMLSPDGKLLARNSAKDTEDEERVNTRKKVFERIENIRQGKGAE